MILSRAIAAAVMLGMTSAAALAASDDVRFVTCPIYRDTDLHLSNKSEDGRRTGCWLVDDPGTGKRYEVNESWSKPDWAYGVLVEGKIAKGAADVCGGITLDPVFTSILYDRDCPRRHLLAEGYTGRHPTMSKRYVMPESVERKLPPKPYKTMTFSPVYDFNSAFVIWNLSDYALDQAIHYIRAANPKKVIVTGWAATQPVEVSGVRLAEDPGIAKERADGIVESMLRMGVPREIIEEHVRTDAQPVDIDYLNGLVEPSRRRVDITVVIS